MALIIEDKVWSEKYRPKTIDDIILPDRIKNAFKAFVKEGASPNLLLAGPAGIGKTTMARAMMNDLDADYKFINGSLDGDLANLKNDVQVYCSAASFDGGRKYVIWDEADWISPRTQPALRGFVETFSQNCGFIFTCNYPNRLMSTLRSRCAFIDFALEKNERVDIATQYLARTKQILEAEGVSVESDKILVVLIKKYFPDFRRILNEIQSKAAETGSITTAALANTTDEDIKEFFSIIQKKDFTAIRRWIAENGDLYTGEIYRKMYDHALTVLNAQTIPLMILIINKYQEQDTRVIDKEINLTACAVELMSEVIFK